MRISCIVYDSFELDFVLLTAHLSIDFLFGSEFVRVVDVDVVGFDIMGDGVIMFGFPKPGLSGSAIKAVSISD